MDKNGENVLMVQCGAAVAEAAAMMEGVLLSECKWDFPMNGDSL